MLESVAQAKRASPLRQVHPRAAFRLERWQKTHSVKHSLTLEPRQNWAVVI